MLLVGSETCSQEPAVLVKGEVRQAVEADLHKREVRSPKSVVPCRRQGCGDPRELGRLRGARLTQWPVLLCSSLYRVAHRALSTQFLNAGFAVIASLFAAM